MELISVARNRTYLRNVQDKYIKNDKNNFPLTHVGIGSDLVLLQLAQFSQHDGKFYGASLLTMTLE